MGGALLAALPLAVGFEVAMAWLRVEMAGSGNECVTLVVNGIFGVPIYAAVTHLLMQKMHGRTLSIPRALKVGLLQWLTIIAAGFVSQLVIMFTLGWFLLPYALVVPLIVGEDKGWYDSLQESRERMYGHRLRMAVLYLPAFLVANAAPFLFESWRGPLLAVGIGLAGLLGLIASAVPVAIYAAVVPRDKWTLTS